MNQSKEGLLESLRHGSLHLLAEAVLEYTQKKATLVGGNLIKNGFYYDFVMPDNSLSMEGFPKIEAIMHRLCQQKAQLLAPMSPTWMTKNLKHHQIIEDKAYPIYQHGEFVDIYRGNPDSFIEDSSLSYFGLTQLSSFMHKPSQLSMTRIHGTAWDSQEACAHFMKKNQQLSETDHRRLGKELALFTIREKSPGMVFWEPNGWHIFKSIQAYIRQKIYHKRYEEVCTPQLLDKKLWEKSGHWNKFYSNMFVLEGVTVIKPMNCPGHVEIFNTHTRSYKDLPKRYAEFGCCHRNETSGSLHGLLRTKCFTQDDGHILLAEDLSYTQLKEEVFLFLEQAIEVYRHFGFMEVECALSTRPEKYIGELETWDKAESILEEVLVETGIQFEISPGEGAFYGPKIELLLKDSLNRKWQCGTIQLDFVLAKRLHAVYVDAMGKKVNPIILHRAILGSIERFIGILIEHTRGWMPLWLAPIQVTILTISQEAIPYAQTIAEYLTKHQIRSRLNDDNISISAKIKESMLSKIPIQFMIGKKEIEDQTISFKIRQNNEFLQKRMPILDFLQFVQEECKIE